MQAYILGVDIGTGSVKAVAVGLNGEAISSSQVYYPMLPLEPGYAEQDPELIWQGFLNCIREIVGRLGSSPQAVSLSSAMHSLILVDNYGKALTNMINWADTRSAMIAEQLRFSPKGKNLYEQTGTPVYSMSPLSKIIWFRENRKDLFSQTAKFISIKELIWFRLFGQFQVDHSIASATGLFDIVQFNWSQDAVNLAGIAAEKLSEPVSTSYMRRDAKAEILKLTGINEASYWVIGANDGCLANLGSGANQPGTAALTIGTSGAVRMASKQPLYNFKAMTFNYILDEKTYICGGAINNGGLILNWLLENFMSIKTVSAANYQQLFAAVETLLPGNNGLLFLPYLTGERTPLWDSNSCGVYFGIKTEHTQTNFLKAALDGVCYAIYSVLDAVVQSSGKIEEIRVSGGFTASRVWVQLMADITGKKLVVVQAEDASAIGAAYLAVQTGKFSGFSLKDQDQHKQIIQPDPEKHLVYSKYYELFVKLYENLKESMQHLAHLNSGQQ
ncbi:gluconokinase [Mucilaginibacter arboris]|uniref:Gluconokinase n=1 Tax=Mucilaginibacter arboris TaxID=2682090 RepID=A0A7K1SSK6_9SPHI|nr:gluconokinase [Mucilaginibacter arboris]MVN20298.1 gluconokinase [Mucilaginibacter arboris]